MANLSNLLASDFRGYTGSQGSGFTGSIGATGFTGSVGFTGSQGTTGFTGSIGGTGFTGSIGATGFSGSRGFTGSIGATGFTGSLGFTGSQGATGFTGSIGATGFTGSLGFTGSQGVTGFTGSIGATGFTGSLGFTGSQGVTGFTGSIGATGFTGSIGATGFSGSRGFTGSIGFTGSQGPSTIPDWITHEGDTDTRFGFPTTDTFAIETAGTEKLRVTSTGDVGIGTATVTANLHVQGTSADGIRLRVENLGNSTGSFSQYTVTSAASALNGYAFANTYTTSGRFVQTSGLIDATGAGGLGLAASGATANMRFYVNGNAVRMTIDNSGNVGIGTSTPLANLHVRGPNSGSTIRLQSTNSGQATFNGSGSGVEIVAADMNTTSKYTPAIKFGSTDANFTTTNPKFGAAIVGEASETYAADTDSGMILTFWTAPNDVGATQSLTERFRIAHTGAWGLSGANYGTSGQVLTSNGTNSAPTWQNAGTGNSAIMFTIDSGSSNIVAGVKGDISIPFNATITEWTMLSDLQGNITVDIWGDTYANYPPTVADTITGTDKPRIINALKGQSTALTGWSTSITSGNTLRFNVDSANNVQRVTLILKITKT